MDQNTQVNVLRSALLTRRSPYGLRANGVPVIKVVEALNEAGYVIAPTLRRRRFAIPERHARDILVSFTVLTDDDEVAQQALLKVIAEHLPGGVGYRLSHRAELDSWHVAEDDRVDSSDCASAVFIPGDFGSGMTQGQAREILNLVDEAFRENRCTVGQMKMLIRTVVNLPLGCQVTIATDDADDQPVWTITEEES